VLFIGTQFSNLYTAVDTPWSYIRFLSVYLSIFFYLDRELVRHRYHRVSHMVLHPISCAAEYLNFRSVSAAPPLRYAQVSKET
jgi:hypothetical protein